MEGSTDKGLFGFGHKKEEEKHEQHGSTPYGTQQHQGVESTNPGGYGAQHQPTKPDQGSTYSAAPGVPPPTEGEGQKPGLKDKLENKLGIDKLKKGHKKSGDDGSSSSSSDEEDSGEKKKKLGIF